MDFVLLFVFKLLVGIAMLGMFLAACLLVWGGFVILSDLYRAKK